MGQKRRFERTPVASHLPRIADVIGPARLVRLVPIAYNLADDAAGENKRIVLGSRWLGGTLHAEAGRSCTVRRRLIGVRGRIYDRLGAMSPHIGSY
jgi:hypothetical protein